MKIEVYHTARTRIKECFSRSEDLFEEIDTLVQLHEETTSEVERIKLQASIDYKLNIAKEWIETSVELIKSLNN